MKILIVFIASLLTGVIVEAAPWLPRPGRGNYRRDPVPWLPRPGRGNYRRDADAWPEPEAALPDMEVYKREAEPEPWHPREGPPVYRRDADAEPEAWHPREGPPVYRRGPEPEASGAYIILVAREAEPEPVRFQPLGEFKREDSPT